MNTERIRVMIADAGYEMLGRQLEAYNGERFDIVCCTADGNEVYDQVLQAQRRRTGSIRAAAGESVIDGAEDYFSVDRGIEPDHQYGI